MEKNIFQLDNEQLKEIARSFKAKVEEGLNTENADTMHSNFYHSESK